MFKLSNFKKSPVTTIIGIITLIIGMLVQFGVFDQEAGDALNTAIASIVNGIAAIVLMFAAKDSSSKEDGAS